MARCSRVLLTTTALAIAALGGCGNTGDGAANGGAPQAAPATPSQASAPPPTTTPTPIPTQVTSRAASGAARCTAANLETGLQFGDGAGAAGSTTGTLTLRNAGAAACTLRGYPGVSFVDGGGHQLGRPAAREAGTTVRTVTLRPGATARADLRIAQAGNFDAAACRPATAAGLRIYPPGSRAATFVRRTLQACSGAAQQLTIAPVGG